MSPHNTDSPAGKLLQIQEVEAEPYAVDGRRLRPVARSLWIGRGRKWSLRLVLPIALIEEADGQQRRLPVHGGGPAVWVVLIALLTPVLLWVLVRRLIRPR